MNTTLKSVAFKMDSDTLDSAKAVLKANGYNLTTALTVFLKNVALTQSVDLPDEDELEKEALFVSLQKEIKQAVDDYEAGKNVYSIEEVRARLGL